MILLWWRTACFRFLKYGYIKFCLGYSAAIFEWITLNWPCFQSAEVHTRPCNRTLMSQIHMFCRAIVCWRLAQGPYTVTALAMRIRSALQSMGTHIFFLCMQRNIRMDPSLHMIGIGDNSREQSSGSPANCSAPREEGAGSRISSSVP